MKLYGKHCFLDLLEDGPLNIDGLKVDTTVEIVVSRATDGTYEIDSSTFGENEIYVLAPEAYYRVRVRREDNPAFFRVLELAVDHYALNAAAKLPEDSWGSTYGDNV